MFWIWLILGIIFFIGLFLLCVKVSVTIQGVYSEQKKSCVLSIGIFSMMIKKTITLYPSSDVERIKEESKENLESEAKELTDINYFIKNFHELHTMGKKLLKRISIDTLFWHTSFGLGDAMETGIAAGALWTVKGGVIGLLSTYVTLRKNVDIDVRPVFQRKGFYTEISSTLSFRCIFIILAMIPIYFYWRKTKRQSRESTGSQKIGTSMNE